jgi:glycyl-tRNA synthetase (class II)
MSKSEVHDIDKQEKIVNYLKTYGFFFPDSEIYGGLSNS